MTQEKIQTPGPDRAEVFIRLLTEHERKLGRYVMLLVPHVHDADEILQEAKIAMWRSFEQFELGTDFPAWARKVVFHQVLKFRRRPSRRVQPFCDETLEILATQAVDCETQFDGRHHALSECLTKLDVDHRMILGLRYNDELPIERIAEQVGRTSGAVYRVLSRIRRTLHECVSKSTRLQGEP